MRITIVVEPTSWQVDHAGDLLVRLGEKHDVVLVSSYEEIEPSELTFLFGCTRIAGVDVLARSAHTLVVHQSDLPRGRGWSPLAWQILEGRSEIPVCLFEAVEGLDEGPVYFRDVITFEGHELVDELRKAQAASAADLCARFVEAYPNVTPEPQVGIPTYYPRRTPESARLDVDASLAEQFDLLRISDNERYPAFFDLRGHRYELRITKAGTSTP